MARFSMGTVALLFAAISVLSVLSARNSTPDAQVGQLSSDAERLQATLRKCRLLIMPADRPVCAAASEAWRCRFFDSQVAKSAPTILKSSAANSKTGELPEPTSSELQPWAFGP